MKQTAKFVPNEEAPQVEERIRIHAERLNQDPETVIAVPFSALEGAINEVNSSLTIDGHPVPVQTVSTDVSPVLVETTTTPLGEQLTDELETFDPLTPSEIAKQTMTYVVGENEDPYHRVIESEKDIARLEQEATTGEGNWGTLIQQGEARSERIEAEAEVYLKTGEILRVSKPWENRPRLSGFHSHYDSNCFEDANGIE